MIISFNDKFPLKENTSQLHKRVYFCKKKLQNLQDLKL
jgi:hypothetical protein